MAAESAGKESSECAGGMESVAGLSFAWVLRLDVGRFEDFVLGGGRRGRGRSGKDLVEGGAEMVQ